MKAAVCCAGSSLRVAATPPPSLRCLSLVNCLTGLQMGITQQQAWVAGGWVAAAAVPCQVTFAQLELACESSPEAAIKASRGLHARHCDAGCMHACAAAYPCAAAATHALRLPAQGPRRLGLRARRAQAPPHTRQPLITARLRAAPPAALQPRPGFIKHSLVPIPATSEPAASFSASFQCTWEPESWGGLPSSRPRPPRLLKPTSG